MEHLCSEINSERRKLSKFPQITKRSSDGSEYGPLYRTLDGTLNPVDAATDQATNASPPVAVTVTVDGSGNANLSLGSGLDIAYGLNGNDTIIGGDGNDVLIGGQNNDSLTGGAGVDSLRGGGNNDNFIFDDGDSGVGALADIIQDFGNGSDRINLTAIDSNINSANDQNFLSASANSATVANSVTWHYDAGTNRTIIHGDVNGNTTADFEIILLGNIALASGDFIL